MSDVVPFDLNCYGGELRFSHIADLLELEALQSQQGCSRPKNELADFISDDPSISRTLKTSLFVLGEDEVEEVMDPLAQDVEQSIVEQIFALLDERSCILGDRYPFKVEGQRLLQKQLESNHQDYLNLLDHTLSHHLKQKTIANEQPTKSFEKLAVTAFTAAGYITSGLMTESGTFADRLRLAKTKLGSVSFSTNNTIIRRSQQDGKVDLLAIENLPLDDRSGRTLIIGQVTCSKSSEWEKKRDEPKPEKWKSLTQNKMSPRACLIVPHHAEADILDSFTQDDSTRSVYDRIRLCLMLGKALPDENSPIPDPTSFNRFRISNWGLAA